ncbi:hypothetical protein ORJ04_00835 [Rheinheimera baltica]|uniref:DUF2846 domain-containing protein n=1 Tax=Rheinheimera baltica TaxID=67576 RepID=A0ABT9HUX5_9GAMM|nr:hypothetical protein [Rheinheimera baltica]MDP5134491.1 hypothetical protein [Rheinheimera baltica]
MKYLPLYCLLLLVSISSRAQFDITGEGKLYPVKGASQEFDFGFSYIRREGSYRFIVGRYNLTVQTVPEKYALALILQNDQHVWVPDFINEPLVGFELKIENYTIRLYQDTETNPDKANFVLQLNDENYYFSSGPGQINFLFSEEGIKDVNVKGMFKPRR